MIATTKIFDSIWWDDFLDKSNRMSKPAVFKDCLTKEETLFMRKSILQILQELANQRTTRYGYRVYVEEGKILNRDEMSFIYDNPPNDDETLEEWWNRVFEDRNIGMIINQGERFNLELSDMIAKKLSPLLKKTGIPTEGIIFTLFIGNYDSTPLGIHLDLPGKNVIHFHLGPGSKTIYTWDDTEKYVKMAGESSQNNKDLETYLPLASKHDFSEGDLFCMPEDTYHIGTQDGLSIGIACWCNNRSKYDFVEKLISMLMDQYLKKDDNIYIRDPKNNLKPDNNPLEDSSFLDSTLQEWVNFPEGYEKLPFNEVLKEIYKNLRYSLHSNAGYRTSPFPLEKDFDFKPKDMIQLIPPYVIQYRESLNKEKLYIYVRGALLGFNNYECVVNFINEINKGEKIAVKELLNMLDPSWDKEVGFYILNLIYKHHGIKVE
ncbi:hypothetical protein [Aquimarina algiphila]|uniref:hypothetical protein n=1 Tax=Aquimarina algiphila TaxID=2047982 RepID=UPI00232C163F|nr:hypothetical protein [Aquimarina algiphila]